MNKVIRGMISCQNHPFLMSKQVLVNSSVGIHYCLCLCTAEWTYYYVVYTFLKGMNFKNFDGVQDEYDNSIDGIVLCACGRPSVVLETKQIHNLALMSSGTLAPTSICASLVISDSPPHTAPLGCAHHDLSILVQHYPYVTGYFSLRKTRLGEALPVTPMSFL